jgi:two-component system, cell cycle response regulator DivK
MINILYVEDDHRSREVIHMVERLNPQAICVTMFENSIDFQARLLNLDPKPDLILLDIHVKPYTGFEMLDMIRSDPAYDAIPVVALTASVMNEEIDTLKSSGFSGILSKPVHLDSFPSLVQRIINGERVWHIQ